MLVACRQRYALYFKNKKFSFAVVAAALLLAASLVVNYYAVLYAEERASNPVTDIVLSNTRVYDVDGTFVYGSFLLWTFVCLLCLYKPQRIPFTFKSVALFTLIRSLFISLTHIGPYPTHAIIQSNILAQFSFGADLFFSGHTGLPFLLALIFWQDKALRTLFLVAAVIFAIVVLLGHLHYSIDVLAAFFITYSICHIAERLFVSDRNFFYDA
ncbi:hypothetical protein A2477_04195 [Candidatus Falkowbacteria bacterium RIFOXYC2_FULL_47_12]|uniref:Sphingomyelin synthase-like domain-containing protein n=2 Tax=Candidatus Falkowiibacteriota TaxID=1752728 RepID=A0A1F5TLT9_9BACT|nr:MAG: hypothetical protein A2242_02870 [Candidatus Falkowbacteria bacterium RIFOXYA2_FULL_47_9]OGF39767.1 MAG: hypothetical protein A2477_04195 [Candidatus Falkowbacteria bacterium RIFOXYC2_FULL_47_12]